MPEGFWAKMRDDPATKALFSNIGGFAAAKAGSIATSATDKLAGDTPTQGAAKGVAEAKEEGKSGVWGGIKGAIKGLFKRGGSSKRPTNIYEQQFIGVPVEQAYENWTEYSKFPEFMKGPESVKVSEEGADENGEGGKQVHQWTAKIFLNRRTWKATVEEDVENRRIRWTTEAHKGTIDGCVTFTPIGDNATLMVYTLEYRPKGFFEWWGNRWRTVGRRARLDVKHFGRYVMMQDQTEEEEEGEQEPESDDETDTDVKLNGDDDDASSVASDEESADESDESNDDTDDNGEPDQPRTGYKPGHEAETKEPKKPKEPAEEPKEPVKVKKPAEPKTPNE